MRPRTRADTERIHSATAGTGAKILKHVYTSCKLTPDPYTPATPAPLQDPGTTGLVPGTGGGLWDPTPALAPESVLMAVPVLYWLLIILRIILHKNHKS